MEIRVVKGDVFTYSADLLVLKHARESYGIDEKIVRELRIGQGQLPEEGRHLLVDGRLPLAYDRILFLGVEPIERFSYQSVRGFSRRALALAAELRPPVRDIVLTLHGAGFGLDEIEAFESELGGIVEAIDAGDYPSGLTTVSIIELQPRRVERMNATLARLLGPGTGPRADANGAGAPGRPRSRHLDTVGYDSAGKQRAIAVMPFSERFEDVYHFGIAQPVRAAGLICERMDEVAFTGDIVAEMKRRIAEASLVIADLSDANPNVYLEVGYAWGVGTPCILLCNSTTRPKFDVRSQRCLYYPTIKQLESTLAAELAKLPSLAR